MGRGEAAAEWVAVEELVPWADNPRDNDDAVAEVAESIKRFGFGAPILARQADGEVIAGHTRLKAAARLGLAQVPVRYLDLDPADAHLLALADNKLNERAAWSANLAAVLRDLDADGADLCGLGWDADEIKAILDGDVAVELGDTVGDDDVEDVSAEEPDSCVGEVYQLGPHRLVCGDSTDPDAWDALLDGRQIDMVWTDPPYGISYVGKTEQALTIMNDSLSEDGLGKLLRDSLGLALAHTKPGGAWYVAAPAGPLFCIFGQELRALEVWRHTLIWSKDRFVLSRSDYHYDFEPIFYGWRPGAAHYFVDDRTKTTTIKCKRPSRNGEHPTMKPVELIEDCINNSSKPGWLVVDPFGGSGSTMIAAAKTGRVAGLIELDPKYCDVIRRRWTRWATANGLEVGTGGLGDVET